MIGLRVRDRSGNILSDMSGTISKVVGSFETGTLNGSRIVDFKLSGEKFFVVVHASNAGKTARLPAVVLDGDTFTWKFGFNPAFGNYPSNAIVYYGVY